MRDTTEPSSEPPATVSGSAPYGPNVELEQAGGNVRSQRWFGDGRVGRPIRFGSGTDRATSGRDPGRVRELLLDVVHEAVEASSRTQLAAAVCERFAESDLYRFARIDEPATGTDRLATRAAAGDRPTGDRAAGAGSNGTGTATGPDGGAGRSVLSALSGRAFRTGDVQHAAVGGRETVGAGDRGGVPAVAVPIGHDDLVFGVLVVVPSAGGLVRNERRELAVVGETIGFACSAFRARELLYAERVTEVEVEFDLGGGSSFLCAAAADLGCSVRLDSYVETNDGDWLLYVAATGGDAAAFEAAVAAAEEVRAVNCVESSDDGVYVGVRARSPLLETVAAVGGVVTAVALSPRRGRLAVEVPQSVDVRLLVGQLRSRYPDATLLSRTTHDRPVRDAPQRTGDIDADLTDRQREVLEACYRAGYFEWPRESTAEEVADLLGIAAPTLHAHLRKAENALLTAFLGDREACDRAAGRPGGGGRDSVPGP